MGDRGSPQESSLWGHLFQQQINRLQKDIETERHRKDAEIKTLHNKISELEWGRRQLVESHGRQEKVHSELASHYNATAEEVLRLKVKTANLEQTLQEVDDISSARMEKYEQEQVRGRKEAESMAALVGKWKGEIQITLQGIRSSVDSQEQRLDGFMNSLLLPPNGSKEPVGESSKDKDDRPATNPDAVVHVGGELVKVQSFASCTPRQVAIDIVITPQGIKSDEGQLRHLKNTIPNDCAETGKYLACEYVKAAVNSFKDPNLRRSMAESLEQRHWDWGAFLEEVPRIFKANADDNERNASAKPNQGTVPKRQSDRQLKRKRKR